MKKKVINMRNHEKFVNDTLANGGNTVSMTGATPARYVFSEDKGTEQVFDLEDFNANAVKYFAMNHGAQLNHDPSKFLGSWVEDVNGVKKVFLDVSTSVDDKREALARAAAADQIAIYDTLTGQEIYV